MVEIGDIVLCTVTDMNKTVVFVKMANGQEGSIVMSEIAPGRIRNIRDYVFPGKSIVCKVLKINGDHVNLSLRRVTPKEIKDMKEGMSLEKSYVSILKSVVGEKYDELMKDILSKESVYSFIEEAKLNKALLEKTLGKENAAKVFEILNSQKKKTVVVKKNFNLSSNSPNGIILIKDLLTQFKDVEIKYLAAGKYSISSEAEDKKIADNRIKAVFDKILDKSKKDGLEFSFKEK